MCREIKKEMTIKTGSCLPKPAHSQPARKSDERECVTLRVCIFYGDQVALHLMYRSFWADVLAPMLLVALLCLGPKGRPSSPKWMNFWKISERPLPIFQKICCNFLEIHDKPVAPAPNLERNFSDQK